MYGIVMYTAFDANIIIYQIYVFYYIDLNIYVHISFMQGTFGSKIKLPDYLSNKMVESVIIAGKYIMKKQFFQLVFNFKKCLEKYVQIR